MNSCGGKPSKPQEPDSLVKLLRDMEAWNTQTTPRDTGHLEKLVEYEHRIKLLLMPHAGPTYPHTGWCEQVLADMGKREVHEEEILGVLTALLWQATIQTTIPDYREHLMRFTAQDVGTVALLNAQRAMTVAIKLARGMGSDIARIMQLYPTKLIQTSICLKPMGGNLYCSKQKAHKGDCA